MKHTEDHKAHKCGRGDVEDFTGPKPPETRRKAGYRKTARNHQSEAAGDVHHPERGYERMRQVKPREHQSVDTPQGRSNCDAVSALTQPGEPALNMTAATTQAKPRMDPTERSIPAVTITS